MLSGNEPLALSAAKHDTSMMVYNDMREGILQSI
jgi:hypothetical protein